MKIVLMAIFSVLLSLSVTQNDAFARGRQTKSIKTTKVKKANPGKKVGHRKLRAKGRHSNTKV